ALIRAFVSLGSSDADWQTLPYALSSTKRDVDMPTRNISLTPEQSAFVDEVVEAGEYQNASEAIRDALRALQQRRKEDGLRLQVLRAQIRAGVDALDRGDAVEIEDADLGRYLKRVPGAQKRLAR